MKQQKVIIEQMEPKDMPKIPKSPERLPKQMPPKAKPPIAKPPKKKQRISTLNKITASLIKLSEYERAFSQAKIKRNKTHKKYNH